MLDLQLRQRAPDLGQVPAVDPAFAGAGSCRRPWASGSRGCPDRYRTRRIAFWLRSPRSIRSSSKPPPPPRLESRVDLAGGVVQRGPRARPGIRSSVGCPPATLPASRPGTSSPAQPLLPMRRALRRHAHQAAALRHCLGPGIAEAKPVLGLQCLMKVLHPKVPIARPVTLDDKLDLVHRRSPLRCPAAPTID